MPLTSRIKTRAHVTYQKLGQRLRFYELDTGVQLSVGSNGKLPRAELTPFARRHGFVGARADTFVKKAKVKSLARRHFFDVPIAEFFVSFFQSGEVFELPLGGIIERSGDVAETQIVDVVHRVAEAVGGIGREDAGDVGGGIVTQHHFRRCGDLVCRRFAARIDAVPVVYVGVAVHAERGKNAVAVKFFGQCGRQQSPVGTHAVADFQVLVLRKGVDDVENIIFFNQRLAAEKSDVQAVGLHLFQLLAQKENRPVDSLAAHGERQFFAGVAVGAPQIAVMSEVESRAEYFHGQEYFFRFKSYCLDAQRARKVVWFALLVY